MTMDLEPAYLTIGVAVLEVHNNKNNNKLKNKKLNNQK